MLVLPLPQYHRLRITNVAIQGGPANGSFHPRSKSDDQSPTAISWPMRTGIESRDVSRGVGGIHIVRRFRYVSSNEQQVVLSPRKFKEIICIREQSE